MTRVRAAKCKHQRPGLPLRQPSRDAVVYKHRFPSLVYLKWGCQKQIIRVQQRRIQETHIKLFFLVLDSTALCNHEYIKDLVDIFQETSTHVIWIMTQETVDYFQRFENHGNCVIKARAQAASSWVQPFEDMNYKLMQKIQERYNRRDWASLQTDMLLRPKTVQALVDGCKWYFEGNLIPYIHAKVLRASRTPISPFVATSVRMCNSLLSRRSPYTFTFLFGDRFSINLTPISSHEARYPAQLIKENHGYVLHQTDNFSKRVDSSQTDGTASPRTGKSSQQGVYPQTDNSPEQAMDANVFTKDVSMDVDEFTMDVSMDVDEFTTDVPMDISEEGLEVAQPSFVIDSHLNSSVGRPESGSDEGIVQVTGSMSVWVLAPGQVGNTQPMGVEFQSTFSVEF